MKDFELTYHQFSERSILVSWPQDITENVLQDVLRFKKSIEKSDIKQIIQVNSAYNSMLINYVSTIDNINDEISRLISIYSDFSNVILSKPRLWDIPVCYDEDFGIDLAIMSDELKLSKMQIIQLHSNAIYRVYFLGFLPGFMYLGGLPKVLHYPRRKSPRSHIQKGAVGIGGAQTGIYPNVSPGGWQIIGNTPIELFDINHSIPCPFQPGDQINFEPISLDDYKSIQHQVEAGSYSIKSKLLDG